MLDDGATDALAQAGSDTRISAQVLEQIISALVVSHILTVNTLHAQGAIDKRHFAHAFARALDVLPKSSENQLVVAILQVLKGYHMQLIPGEQPDVRAWLKSLLDRAPDADA